MFVSNWPATIFTISSAILTILFGAIYLIKPSFLNYHKEATQKNWNELQYELQALILGFMRAVSGGLLSGGFIIITLQYQFNKTRQEWIPLTILIYGGILTTALLYAMLLVKSRTKAHPPLIACILGIILLTIGYILNTTTF
jgi:hypothetical protein